MDEYAEKLINKLNLMSIPYIAKFGVVFYSTQDDLNHKEVYIDSSIKEISLHTSNLIITYTKVGDSIRLFGGEGLETVRPLGTNYCKTIEIDLWGHKIRDISGTFKGYGLTENIIITKLDTSNVKDMSQMFDGCRSISKLDLRNLDVSKVENIDALFRDCWRLNSIDTTGWQLKRLKSARKIFDSCNYIDITQATGLKAIRKGLETSYWK